MILQFTLSKKVVSESAYPKLSTTHLEKTRKNHDSVFLQPNCSILCVEVRENAKFNLIVSLNKKWGNKKKEKLVSFVVERDHKWVVVVAAVDAEYVGAEHVV